jgi:hypothetical protein
MDKKTKANDIRNKFRMRVAIIDSDIYLADVYLEELIYAGTNEKKLAILRDIRERLPEDEFEKLRREVIKNKIVSADVFRRLDR